MINRRALRNELSMKISQNVMNTLWDSFGSCCIYSY